MIYKVADRVNFGLIVDMIFLDFSNAFDEVSHSIILIKLQMLGVGDKLLLWVHDFLVGHTICVQVVGDEVNQNQSPVVFHKDLCWVRFCF